MIASDALSPVAALWSRVKGAAPYVVAAALFGLGLFALYKLLAPVDFRAVMAQVRATPWSTLAVAMTATLGGYAALIGYDWSALRHIGKRLPFGAVVVGGFLGYAFGNTIGLSALSGGAVRYRIYSALGLDGYDVAAVSTFAAASFGVAATVIGLGALALHPAALAAVSPLPPETMRWLAAAGVLVIAVPLAVAAARRGALRFGRFTLSAPSLPVLGAQVVFSACDIALSALTLYVLLPGGDLGFAAFLAVFAAATMAGIASHVPGGVGVFETVVLAALPASVPLDQAAAALLLYRLIYYLMPFGLALVVLAVHEARLSRLGARLAGAQEAALAPAFRAVGAVAPLALAAMVFASGLWMTVGALVPSAADAADDLELLTPLAFVEFGALMSSALGAVLIVIAHGMLNRSEAAWWLALGAMIAGAAAALAHGLDVDRALWLLAGAAILIPCRREFHRRARLTERVFSPGWIALIAAALAALAFTAFFAHKSTAYSHELWWRFAFDAGAPRAMRAGLVASLLLALGLLWMGLRSGPRRSRQPGDEA